MKKGDVVSSLIAGTFFLVINILVTLGQYYFVGMPLRASILFFIMTAILDYAVANIYISKRKKYYMKYWRQYGRIFKKSAVGFIYIKLPRVVKGIPEKAWFLILRIFLIQKIIDWSISYVYDHQKDNSAKHDFALNKKKETIAFVADTKAMFVVYYVVYFIKLSLLLAFDNVLTLWSLSGNITLGQYLFSLVLAALCMLFGAHILAILIDRLKDVLERGNNSNFGRNVEIFSTDII